MEVLNSDDSRFGGSGVVNEGKFTAEDISMHGMDQSLSLTLPPLAAIYIELDSAAEAHRTVSAAMSGTVQQRRAPARGKSRTGKASPKKRARKKQS